MYIYLNAYIYIYIHIYTSCFFQKKRLNMIFMYILEPQKANGYPRAHPRRNKHGLNHMTIQAFPETGPSAKDGGNCI